MITLPRILAGAVAVIALVGLIALSVDSCGKRKVRQGEQQADVSHGEANAHQQHAAAADSKVADLQAQVSKREADLGRLRAERDALLRKLASQPVAHVDPASPVVPVPVPVGDDRDALIAKDAEVISAQAKVIEGQKLEIGALTLARDEWKATAQARDREAAGLRIALDAQKSVSKADKWIGRVQGFAIGIGVGYVGGRIK